MAVENPREMARGAVGGALATVTADATIGLERAAQAAGDVLRGIFGGLPWEMSPGEIVDAVTGAIPGGGENAADAAGLLIDIAGVVV